MALQEPSRLKNLSKPRLDFRVNVSLCQFELFHGASDPCRLFGVGEHLKFTCLILNLCKVKFGNFHRHTCCRHKIQGPELL